MKKIILIVCALMLLGQVRAEAAEWKLDPPHANFYFEIKHVYATIRGQFNTFSGDVAFDPDNLAQSRFNVEIKTESVNTNNEKRDTHLRSGDFFDATKFPVMTFKSTRMTHLGGNRYLFDGKLTIKDVTRDVALEFIYQGQKENALSPGELVTGLDSRFTLDRLDYHVGDGKFYKMGIVGKDVDILISVEMGRKK